MATFVLSFFFGSLRFAWQATAVAWRTTASNQTLTVKTQTDGVSLLGTIVCKYKFDMHACTPLLE
jgi:hypothetical protein